MLQNWSEEFIKPRMTLGTLLHKLAVDHPTENRPNSGCVGHLCLFFHCNNQSFHDFSSGLLGFLKLEIICFGCHRLIIWWKVLSIASLHKACSHKIHIKFQWGSRYQSKGFSILVDGRKKGAFLYWYLFSFEFKSLVKKYLTNQHSSLKYRNLHVVNKLPFKQWQNDLK